MVGHEEDSLALVDSLASEVLWADSPASDLEEDSLASVLEEDSLASEAPLADSPASADSSASMGI